MGSLTRNAATTTTTTTSSHPSTSNPQPERNALSIVGINVLHTIAPPMHNRISTLLSLPTWTFTPHECPTIATALSIFRRPDFAGAVVTMPYKKTIMSHLDELDPLATQLGACNCVYLTAGGKLRGTNTDWRGIRGCLVGAADGDDEVGSRGKPALIVGAGGASRAAVFALGVELASTPIYLINRDEAEVRDLIADVEGMVSEAAQQRPEIIHVTSVAQARSLPPPYYIVGTVPDFEPQTPAEILARDTLEAFLEAGAQEKGVLLDMCFKPRVTRQIKLARRHGWTTVDGTGIIGHQIAEQWRLWAGVELSVEQQEEAWRVLREAAEASKAINF